MWCKQGFCLFPVWLFRGYDGCERGDRGCGWCDGVGWCGGAGVVEVVCSVKMGVRSTYRSTWGECGREQRLEWSTQTGSLQ